MSCCKFNRCCSVIASNATVWYDMISNCSVIPLRTHNSVSWPILGLAPGTTVGLLITQRALELTLQTTDAHLGFIWKWKNMKMQVLADGSQWEQQKSTQFCHGWLLRECYCWQVSTLLHLFYLLTRLIFIAHNSSQLNITNVHNTKHQLQWILVYKYWMFMRKIVKTISPK